MYLVLKGLFVPEAHRQRSFRSPFLVFFIADPVQACVEAGCCEFTWRRRSPLPSCLPGTSSKGNIKRPSRLLTWFSSSCTMWRGNWRLCASPAQLTSVHFPLPESVDPALLTCMRTHHVVSEVRSRGKEQVPCQAGEDLKQPEEKRGGKASFLWGSPLG